MGIEEAVSLALDMRGTDNEMLQYLVHHSASKNTDLSVFFSEIETKILNTDSDVPQKY